MGASAQFFGVDMEYEWTVDFIDYGVALPGEKIPKPAEYSFPYSTFEEARQKAAQLVAEVKGPFEMHLVEHKY